MSNIVKFVSAQYVKESTVLEMNIDDAKITPIIIKVQDVYLQQILGSSFYNHLRDAVTNSTLNANEDALIRDYIQRFVCEYVVYEAIPYLNYKATNKAVSKESSEYSTPAELAEIKYMRSNVKDMAEFMGKRLAKYLCDNPSLFPEYQNPIHPENLPKNNKAYFNGLFIPKRRNVSGLPTWDEPFNCI
jgi:hypothetical protein